MITQITTSIYVMFINIANSVVLTALMCLAVVARFYIKLAYNVNYSDALI